MIKLPHDIIGKAVADAAFRKNLFTNPEATLRAEGVTVDAATLTQLQNIDLASVERMLEDVGGELGQAAAI